MRYVISLIVVSLTMYGCAGARLSNQSAQSAADIEKNIGEYREAAQAPAFVYVDVPQTQIVSQNIVDEPSWYGNEYSLTSSGIPFSILADDVAQSNKLVPYYSKDMQPSDLNFPVYLDYENGTVIGALRNMASATGLHFEVDGSVITWSKYETERFDLGYISGTYSYSLDSASSAGGIESDSANSFKVESYEGDVFDEIQSTVEALIAGEGQVVLSKATSSLTVRAQPSKVSAVREYMKAVNRTLATQVEIAVQVVKFRRFNGAESGINWNLVRKAAAETLTFDGQAGSGVSTSVTQPFTIGSTATSGDFDTSNLLVSALEEQGTVSIETEPRVVTQVNRVAELKVTETRSYIASVETTTTATGTTSAVTPNSITEGYTLYVIANVDENDQVYLQITSLLSDLVGIDERTEAALSIQLPRTQDNKFAQTVVLRAGETVIANSIKQVSRNGNASSPVSASIAPTYKSGEYVTEEIVVLVTPTIIKGK